MSPGDGLTASEILSNRTRVSALASDEMTDALADGLPADAPSFTPGPVLDAVAAVQIDPQGRPRGGEWMPDPYVEEADLSGLLSLQGPMSAGERARILLESSRLHLSLLPSLYLAEIASTKPG